MRNSFKKEMKMEVIRTWKNSVKKNSKEHFKGRRQKNSIV